MELSKHFEKEKRIPHANELQTKKSPKSLVCYVPSFPA